MATVQVFNASSQSIMLMVNQGPQFAIAGTGASLNWVPQVPTTGGPTYTSGNAAPNVIGNLGTNTVTAYVSGSPIGGGPFTFSLPTNYPVGSVQLYLFFASVQSATWMVLTDGMICAQQVVSMNVAKPHEHHESSK